MKVTPLEIKQKIFSGSRKGYDKEEVSGFLLVIADEFEKLIDQAKEAQIRVSYLEKEIAKLKEVENSLFKTLQTAEETSSNMVEQARKNAEIKVKDAQLKAEVILNDARTQAKAIVQKSQLRARNILSETIDELRIKEKDYHLLETYRENLLMSVRGFINDTSEKIERLNTKDTQDYFAEKIHQVRELIAEKEESITNFQESDTESNFNTVEDNSESNGFAN